MEIERSLPDEPLNPDRQAAESPLPTLPCESPKAPGTLVEMNHVSVSFASTPVLRNFSWTMRHGENWAILGPNGAGKSTVLALIAGDHLQAYANRIRLFGRQRGSGESIWEIKRHIGFISPELHARYHKRMSAFDVVCSGFFDSIGLYRLCSAKQIDKAEQWVKALNLGDLCPLPFQELSHGQRQLVLIGRAMVKSPLLLILDEPCEGLDKTHRHRLLAMLDEIGRRPDHHLIYVTHHPSELPGCITHVLKLKNGRVEAVFAN
jgi:molybdate transport system ATP-binding protein